MKQRDSSQDRDAQRAEQPIADDGGIQAPIPDTRDPYEILDDMMAVVELLCPEYPERELFREDGEWRL